MTDNRTDKPLSAAIVGVGAAKGKGSPTGGAFRIGYLHAEALARSGRLRLVSAADIDPENLAAFQAKFNLDNGHPSLQAMLDAVRPDVVHICTYVGLHLSMIEACAAAGVPGIVCEKPFVNSPAELIRLRELVDETGIKIIVPHFRRHLPAFERARDIYRSGDIGERVAVTAAIGDGWDLSEWGSHWLDMFRFFHDEAMPEWVMGQARVADRRGFGHAMEDHAIAAMQFPCGGRATLEVGPSYLPDAINMVLCGTRGMVMVRDERRVTVYSSGGQVQEDFSGKHDVVAAWAGMFDQLAEWIAGGPEPELGFSHVSGTAELNLASYMSMVTGDRVDLPMRSNHGEWPVEALARRAMSRVRTDD